MRHAALTLMAGVWLVGCAGETVEFPPVEAVRVGPIAFEVRGKGQLKAASATALLVPGKQWSRRQLIWMVPDGSQVKAGEPVARFAAGEAELELEKALLDLQRNALSRAAKEGELEIGEGRVEVDLDETRALLGIAQRYADADIDALARNVILDAIQDRTFLDEKRGVLSWRQTQSQRRGAAELQVLDAQRATMDGKAQSRRDDLEGLSLSAPHDGVFMLGADWSGEKPQIGADLWAGNGFATLPDIGALEVEISVPQIQAQGLVQAGLEVRLWPLGRPEQAVESTLSWLASAPQTRSRESPVKYLAMKAPVPAQVARSHGWVPGQAFEAVIVLGRAQLAWSVSNLALEEDNGVASVQVLEHGRPSRREVRLGRRGTARSEVLSGLADGDRVVIVTAVSGSVP